MIEKVKKIWHSITDIVSPGGRQFLMALEVDGMALTSPVTTQACQ